MPAARQRGILRDVEHLWQSLDDLDRIDLGQSHTLLRLISCLPDGPIPFDMLLLAELMAESELFWGLNGPRLTRLMHGLRDAGLVELSTTADGIDVLDVGSGTADAIRADLAASGQLPACAALWSNLMYFATAQEIAGRPDDAEAYPRWELLAPIELHLFDLVVAQFPAGGEDYVDPAANSALHAADYLAERGRAAEAAAAADKVFQGCRASLGADHHRTLLAAAFTGTFAGRAGHPSKAVEVFADILARRLAHFPPGHEDTDFAYYGLALWNGRAGDPGAACDGFARLAELRATHLGPEHADTLWARTDLGYWTAVGGDVHAARSLWSGLLPTARRVVDSEDPLVRQIEDYLAEWPAPPSIGG